MKILITEDQLEKIVNNFLDRHFNDLVRISDSGSKIRWYHRNNDELQFMYADYGTLYYPFDTRDMIGNVFNLQRGKADIFIKRWVQKNLSLPGEITKTHTI